MVAVPSSEDLKNYQSDNKLMAAALYNRKIPIDQARNIVLNPYKGFTTPLYLINRNAAVELIKRFMDKENGKICIFADYDADGITSAAITVQCLNYFHAALKPDEEWMAYCHVPEREDGYGISEEWCKKFIGLSEEEVKNLLVITVDNGITKKSAIDILQQCGITVLVTDHHPADFENNLTPSCVCVDPQIDDRKIGINLAGCGVIFNLLRHFENCYLNGDHTATDKYEYLMAIGTVGDVMRMDYYHGCVVAWGLQQINSDRCPTWLREVLDHMKISYVTGKTISFSLAAFLNACGQAGKANLALDIILEPDMYKREQLMSEAFDLYNTIRKITKEEKERAEEEIKASGADKHSVIIYGVKTDYPGIVGKIAYHLSELTNKPAICYNDKGEDIVRGSSRNANETIPFYDLLKEAQRRHIIISANGHFHAQGCEFVKSNIPEILDFMDQMVDSMIRTGKSTFMFKKELTADQIITADDISLKNVQAIECFPFANNWKEPMLYIKNADLVDVHASKNNNKNICYTIRNSNGKDVELWVWNIKPNSYDADKHTKISLIGTLSRDFRNEQRPMFNVTDFKLA